LGINPPTAYAMLTQIVPLNREDCIIQNGANSGVGRAVIQLAKCRFKQFGIKCPQINILNLKTLATKPSI
jgi:NADPH:quinone reductase-like Zn-dependent oxidoreductase